ncbi:hypothetical protein QVD17_04111 [Tagetes erecta]|uniref:Uncharacterized protein n=1 Tax=Tagetes erecta TaxID=13708 RepID=A0AAD8PA74_TARER|nr:hypothetical protein QVD17_04111 [Tagetes erecta]
MVEILSSSVHGILNQPSPFVNLKSLEIYLERYTLLNQAPKNVGISTKLKSYLLDGSSGGAIVTFTLQEIQAQNLMDELRSLLEKESDNSKTKETQVESHEPKNLKIGANMEQIKNCWDNLAVQIEKARLVISKVQEIEELLSKVLTSKRSKLQSCFSSLCTEADTVINQVTDYMKIHCDENQSLSSVCATTLESFS